MVKPMNLLFIFSDQHTRRASACYGNKIVKTPNLDRLAEGGGFIQKRLLQWPHLRSFERKYGNWKVCERT